MASTWTKRISVSIWGESHSESIGVILDGLPAGEAIDWEELLLFMGRRRSQGGGTDTPRMEADLPEIQSGLLDGRTCGTPLCALIRNSNTRPKDYSLFEQVARPGHADYSGFLRYEGYNDVRGGGHFSGRLTAALCFAGGVAKQLLARKGIRIAAHIQQIGSLRDGSFLDCDLSEELLQRLTHSLFPLLNVDLEKPMTEEISAARAQGDSVGGMVECAIVGLPGGYGDPFFDSIESRLSSLLFSIPAVKGVEFGDGFGLCGLRGSQANDPFRMEGGKVITSSNHNGGILGGISTGMPIIFRCGFKPTPSISRPQQSVNFITGENVDLEIQGRHDPCIVRRAVPVVEAAAALAVLDLLLASDKRWNEQ